MAATSTNALKRLKTLLNIIWVKYWLMVIPYSIEDRLEKCFAEERDYFVRVVGRMLYEKSVIDDIIQDGFLLAWKARASFRGKSTLRTWVCRIVIHSVYEYFRKIRKKSLEIALTPLHDPPSGERSAYQIVYHNEQIELVRKEIPRIPKSLQHVPIEILNNGTVTTNLDKEKLNNRKFRAIKHLSKRLNHHV